MAALSEFVVIPVGLQGGCLATKTAKTSASIRFGTTGQINQQGWWRGFDPIQIAALHQSSVQTWALPLQRESIAPTRNHFGHTPHGKKASSLRNAADTGNENISPGRNMQFIPYGLFRSFLASIYAILLAALRLTFRQRWMAAWTQIHH